MNRRILPLLAVFAVAIFSVGPLPSARSEEPALPRFFIWPVTTELQKQLTVKDANVYVLLDASEALKGDKHFLANLKALREPLLKYKKPDRRLNVTLFYHDPVHDPVQAQNQNLFRLAAIGLAHELGFSKVTGMGSHQAVETSWEDRVGQFRSPNIKDKAEENPKGDGDVKAYPVQTEYSRFLTSGADCAVLIQPSLEKEQGVIPDKIRAAVKKRVDELKLTQKKSIAFVIRHFESDESTQPLVNEFHEFAKDLGFETDVVIQR